MTAVLHFAQPLTGDALLTARFSQPVRILQANQLAEVAGVIEQVEAAAQAGLWCIGGLKYEAASALDPNLVTHQSDGPLAWFAIFTEPQPAATLTVNELPQLQWHELDRPGFTRAISQIHNGISAGEFYQINYTQNLHGAADSELDPWALFAALYAAQPGGYSLGLDLGTEQLLSVSPELFFELHQPVDGPGEILTRPMKGTAARGATPTQDQELAQQLTTSAKERAENVMIVDLLRNDLAKIAEPGTVHVPKLLSVEALPTLWQMTSDVRARTQTQTSLLEVITALFPCGSVTGAPKAAAMKAIRELETEPRGWYCGMLGLVRSDGNGGIRATFNVPIRTVVARGPKLSCGIGSGITIDAPAEAEWAEWSTKQGFLERVSQPFELLETLALIEGELRHLGLHRTRLAEAAQHFGYPFDGTYFDLEAVQLQRQYRTGSWRVRFRLAAGGQLNCDVAPLPTTTTPVRLQLATTPMQAPAEFVRYKTTRRSHYEAFSPADPEIFDTILFNAAGEITECTRGNIAAKINGQWITPPLESGLLPGVRRAIALEQGELIEHVLRLEYAAHVTAWAYLNSLRGWLPAEALGSPTTIEL